MLSTPEWALACTLCRTGADAGVGNGPARFISQSRVLAAKLDVAEGRGMPGLQQLADLFAVTREETAQAALHYEVMPKLTAARIPTAGGGTGGI